MIKSKPYYPANSHGGSLESLHLSGLLTGYDPEQSADGLSDRRSGASRRQTTAASVTVHSSTKVRPPAIVAADSLTELGMLSAQVGRGGIGGMRLAAKGKCVPVGAISILVVILTTLVVGFECRRPLGNMLFSGPAPVTYKTSAFHRIAAPSPRRTPTLGLADPQPRRSKSPAPSVLAHLNPLPKASREHRTGTLSPAQTADRFRGGSKALFNDPPGALFTHFGTSQ